MKLHPVKFQPIATERIWGGHRLKSWFDAEQIENPIGEYWVVSGHPSATSVVSNGPLAGLTLTELTERYPEAYLGASAQPRFPLLIKVIEAQADLSVQVHPGDEYAQQKENDFGKTEAWYVLEAPQDGKVVYGHRFTNREEYFRTVEEQRVKDYLQYREIAPGQLVFVPAGTLHALLADTAVIEIQQTSDVTYRVYDWDRKDTDGKERQLHVQQAAEVLAFGDAELNDFESITLLAETGLHYERVCECGYFSIEKVSLQGRSFSLSVEPGRPNIVIGVSGTGIIRWEDGELPIQPGEAILIPATLEQYEMKADEKFAALRVFY